MCYFCAEFSSFQAPESRIIWESDDFLLLPTIGCFSAGYCLLMPRDHELSFGSLSRNQVSEGFKVVGHWRQQIEKTFGHAIVAEHGAGQCLSGAACCDHAHLHIIPVHGRIGQVSRAYLDVGGTPEVLNEPEEVTDLSGAPYILFSPRPGQWWLWREVEAFQRQFVRRVCARALGVEPYSDWRKHTFKENMKVTKEVLTGKLNGSITESPDVAQIPTQVAF